MEMRGHSPTVTMFTTDEDLSQEEVAMVQAARTDDALSDELPRAFWEDDTAHSRWIESIGVPIHRGHFVEDARGAEVGWWEERGCFTAFVQLQGQQSNQEARITEIPPAATLRPLKFALDELVYVLEGRGLTTVQGGPGGQEHTFEWQKHSLFLIPRNFTHQHASTQGESSSRLLHVNYLPLAMATVGEPSFFFNNPYNPPGSDLPSYSVARRIELREGRPSVRMIWYGNFFPDLQAWDSLETSEGRGAGGHIVWMRFPRSPMGTHMSVFPARTYKKAHRHGPGFVIVVPGGEGYSILWEEGKDKIVVPWHEGSVFVPPDQWFHQHFNLSGAPARYLALHPPMGIGFSETVKDLGQDQIEYPDEDPMIRQMFEAELAKRGLGSLMPDEAYRDRHYRWAY